MKLVALVVFTTGFSPVAGHAELRKDSFTLPGPRLISGADRVTAKSPRGGMSREEAMPSDPFHPAGMDTRTNGIDAPEMAMQLSQRGPVVTVGALGSRYKDMPSLAHVGLAWNF